MKRIFIFGLVGLVAMSAAQKKPAAQIAVEKQVAKYVQAFDKKDVNAMMTIFAADYHSVGVNGMTADVKKLSDSMKSLFSVAKNMKITSTVQSFRLDKAGAHVMRLNSFDALLPGPKGKMGKFHSESRIDEIWATYGGVWKVKFSKQLGASRTYDGKPIK